MVRPQCGYCEIYERNGRRRGLAFTTRSAGWICARFLKRDLWRSADQRSWPSISTKFGLVLASFHSCHTLVCSMEQRSKGRFRGEFRQLIKQRRRQDGRSLSVLVSYTHEHDRQFQQIERRAARFGKCAQRRLKLERPHYRRVLARFERLLFARIDTKGGQPIAWVMLRCTMEKCLDRFNPLAKNATAIASGGQFACGIHDSFGSDIFLPCYWQRQLSRPPFVTSFTYTAGFPAKEFVQMRWSAF